MIVRELTSGVYFGEPRGIHIEDNMRVGINTQRYTEAEIERAARAAFELAKKRGNKVCSMEKANVMESGVLWREIVQKVRDADYSDVELSHMYADAGAMQLVRAPKQFDVILTSNMFGDIISDESSVLTGSLGMLPSSSIGEKTSLFEPIHGSYPQATGLNIANPMAAVLSAAMMFENFGLQEEGQAIRDAVNNALDKGIVTEDLADGGTAYGTKEVGDWLAANI